MGQVYLAHDTLLDRPVAIKFIAAEPSAVVRERFLVEARAIARLSHPNVVSVYRVGELLGRPYLVSEFVKGKSLADLPRPVPVEQGVQIGLGLCAGLKAAHSSGVLHRDVKPANAILADSGEAKLLDFGLAKLVPGVMRSDAEEPAAAVVALPDAISGDEATLTPEAEAKSRASAPSGPGPDVTLSAPGGAEPADSVPSDDAPLAALREPTPVSITKTGALVGTPRYMAPEIFAGEAATTRSDVYSLGALLFELLTGRAPFIEPDLVRLSIAVRLRSAPPARGLLPEHPKSDALAAVIDRCLRREPKERYADGGELLRALQAVAQLTPAGMESASAVALQAASVASESENAQRSSSLAQTSAPGRSVRRSIGVVAGIAGLLLAIWKIGFSPTSDATNLGSQAPSVSPQADRARPVDLATPRDLGRAVDLAVTPDLSSLRPAAAPLLPAGTSSTRRLTSPGKKSPSPLRSQETQAVSTTEPVKNNPDAAKAKAETPAGPVETTAPPLPAATPTKTPAPERIELPIER